MEIKSKEEYVREVFLKSGLKNKEIATQKWVDLIDQIQFDSFYAPPLPKTKVEALQRVETIMMMMTVAVSKNPDLFKKKEKNCDLKNPYS